MPPFFSTAILSPILIASSMSWVTKTIVLRISDWSRRNSFWSRSRLIGSIAPNGSSMRSSGGGAGRGGGAPAPRGLAPGGLGRVGGARGERAGHADALALAAGELGRVAVARLVRVERDELEQLVHARRDALLVPAEQPRDGGDVVLDLEVREQADLLDRVADLAAQLGR